MWKFLLSNDSLHRNQNCTSEDAQPYSNSCFLTAMTSAEPPDLQLRQDENINHTFDQGSLTCDASRGQNRTLRNQVKLWPVGSLAVNEDWGKKRRPRKGSDVLSEVYFVFTEHCRSFEWKNQDKTLPSANELQQFFKYTKMECQTIPYIGIVITRAWNCDPVTRTYVPLNYRVP